jgi:subtilase family serine protease
MRKYLSIVAAFALMLSQLAFHPVPTAAAGGADLVVTDVTWSPASPSAGNEVTFSAVIKNQGGDPSPAGTIHGVLFTVNGTSVSWSDNYASSIPAGASVTVTATGGPASKATWTAASGTHTVRAFVDDINRIAESNDGNNTFDKSMTVGSGTGGGTPDLVVTDISWTPATPQTGGEVTFSAVVKNQGTGATAAGTIHGVLFTVNGTSASWSDNYASSIPAGASVTVTATGGPASKATWTAAAGTHAISAFVDDVNRIAESNDNNNTYEESLTVGSGSGGGTPDLVVTDIAWTPASPQTGDEVTFSAVVMNQGTGTTPAGTIHGVLFTVNGTSVAWSDSRIASIAPGASVTLTSSGGPGGKATWTSATGTHTVRAFVDDINRIAESNDNNNTRDESLTVNLPSMPDLIVTDISWAPAAPAAGNGVTFSAVVKNQGTAATPSGTAINASFLVNGTKVSSALYYTSSIAAGASVTLTRNSGSWTAVNGIHAVNAVVDETGLIGELDETNNTYGESLTIGAVQTYGATMPYDSYEAEDLTITGGYVTGPSTTWTVAESEASGRKAVRLSQGQSVQLTLQNPAQGIVVRYSMPDSATGSDIYQNLSVYTGGTHAADLALTNRYSHQYGQYGSDGGEMQWSNAPGVNHHRFFDESRVLLGGQVAAGTTIKLQWDANDSNPSGNSYVLIDLIETEAVPAALAKPSDYVSIAAYGAVANDGADDTAAMTAAIAAVNGTSVKGVWIPEGTFHFNTGTRGTTKIRLPSGVSVKGAGMWRSTVQGAYAGFYLQGGNVTLSDFTIKAEETYRSNATGIAGIEGNALNSTIMNIWIQHSKVGLWLNEGTNNALVSKVRVRDVWADGINVNGGTKNTIVEQSSFRNTGDDGMAMWSKSLNGGAGTVESVTFRYNTIQIPNLANGIGIYGGKNNTVNNNLVMDTVDNGSAIQFGTYHAPTAFTGTLTVSNNKLMRSGSYHHDYGYQIGALWGYWVNNNGLASGLTVNVTGNIIDGSTYSGVFIEEPSNGVTINYTGNTINNSGTYGVHIRGSAGGTAAFNNNTVNVAPSGKLKNDSPSFTVTGTGNNW